MKAFVLAAGFGSRMKELTKDLPKPLLPVGGFPLIYYTLFWLWKWGADEVIINLHYLGDEIQRALDGFLHYPIRFSRETEILGTAGGIRNCVDEYLRPKENFILLNPDTVLVPDAADDPAKGLSFLNQASSPSSLLYLKERSTKSVAGMDLREDARLHFSNQGRYYYIGYSILRAADLLLPENAQDTELGPIWRRMSEQGRVAGKVFQGEILDAGTKAAYLQIRDRFPLPEACREDWEEFLRGVPERRL